MAICVDKRATSIETLKPLAVVDAILAKKNFGTSRSMAPITIGLGTAVAGIFGSLPNTSFSQNVGLIAMTGVMSRTVVTIGAVFLIICGLIPKVGAIISTIPIEVFGGGVIVMFGMVVAAGISMLSDVDWNRRNMVIFAISISIGLGLQLERCSTTPSGHSKSPSLFRSLARCLYSYFS